MPGLVGVQIGAHSIFDEGVGHCLDLLQETAGVNAVFVYANILHGFASGRGLDALADDHGVPPRDPRSRRLCPVHLRHDPQRFRATALPPPVALPGEEYADRDVFAELAEPCRARGIRVYARILEAHHPAVVRRIPGLQQVLTIDLDGRRGHTPCWRHPDYRAWHRAIVEDICAQHPLAGFQWGAERVGPLSNLLFRNPHVNPAPVCFCEHCCSAARAEGVDPAAARAGFAAVQALLAARWSGEAPPSEGLLISVLGCLIRHPEVLAWERLWRDGKESLIAELGGVVKAFQPAAEYGRHVDHQASTWDPIYRAAVSPQTMARSVDFLKPIVYRAVLGMRLRHWFLERAFGGVLGELDPLSALPNAYRVLGLDPEREPGWEQLDASSMSNDYVYRMTRRLVLGVAGQAKVYAGIGIDVPGTPAGAETEALIEGDVGAALDAGAAGILISREYDEMRVPHLRAIGRALRARSSAQTAAAS